jgi:hypothetical protein
MHSRLDNEAMEPAENSDETVRRVGRPFLTGQSGNPGGRPKGVARTVREVCGGSPLLLAQGLLGIAMGEGLHGKPVRQADRIRATELLLAYGWGKPPAFAAIEGPTPSSRTKSPKLLPGSSCSCAKRKATTRLTGQCWRSRLHDTAGAEPPQTRELPDLAHGAHSYLRIEEREPETGCLS